MALGFGGGDDRVGKHELHQHHQRVAIREWVQTLESPMHNGGLQ